MGAGSDRSTRSSENDSVLLRPLPPQAAVQGAKGAVLLLLLLSKLHKHLENTEKTPMLLVGTSLVTNTTHAKILMSVQGIAPSLSKTFLVF